MTPDRRDLFGTGVRWTPRRAALTALVGSVCVAAALAVVALTARRFGHVLDEHASLPAGQRPEGLWFLADVVPFALAAVLLVVILPLLTRWVVGRWGSPRVRSDVEEWGRDQPGD